MPQKLWTVRELSLATKRSKQRIHELAKEGKLPVMWVGQQIVIPDAAALAFINRCREIDGDTTPRLPGLDEGSEAA